jgi:hypothetical protein
MPNIKKVFLFLIKYSPGLAVIFYAYLYFAGYYFLSSFFLRWGLNSHEMGYSIIDYATVGISPLFTFILISTYAFALAYGFRRWIRGLKNRVLSTLLIIVPPIGLILAFLILNHPVTLFLALFLGIIVLFYLVGSIAYSARIEAKKTTPHIIENNWLWIIIFLIAVIPVFNWQYGRHNADTYLSYTSNPFLRPVELSDVNIYSNGPINGMEIFEAGPNKYSGLKLLAFKNDVYYLVASLKSLELMGDNLGKFRSSFDAINKEITDTDAQVAEMIKTSNAMISEGDKLDKDLDAIEKGIGRAVPSSMEWNELVAKRKEYVESAKQWKQRKKDNIAEMEAKQKQQKERLETLKNLQGLTEVRRTEFSKILRTSYAVRKEQINDIEFLTRILESNPNKKIVR